MRTEEINDRMVRNADDLIKLAADLGYDTYPQQLTCRNGAHVSGLLNFFNDNPGALEVVVEWIAKHHGDDSEEDYESEEE